MRTIIVNTNILFSALLNINSRIGQILINGARYYEFYSPETIRFEITSHKDKIKEIARLSEDEFIDTYELVIHNISILSHSVIPIDIYNRAESICESIDIDDTVFVALNEFMQGHLWTGDLQLLNGLNQKGYQNLVKTDELFQDYLSKRNLE